LVGTERYRPLAKDGEGSAAVGDGLFDVATPGASFELAMTMNEDCGDKLEILGYQNSHKN
jgi:hypothetical protein